MEESSYIIPQEPDEAFMTYVLYSLTNGLFKSVELSPEIEPYIYRKVIYKNPGDQIELFDGGSKVIGIIFMKFPDVNTMNKMLNRIDDYIHLKLK